MDARQIFIEGHQIAKSTRDLFNSYRAAFAAALRRIYAGLRALVLPASLPEDGSKPEGQFYNVTLMMTDSITGRKVKRVIDKTVAFSIGSECWELRGLEAQRKNIESWIEERGNEQHEMELVLDNWFFCV